MNVGDNGSQWCFCQIAIYTSNHHNINRLQGNSLNLSELFLECVFAANFKKAIAKAFENVRNS